MRLQFSPFPDLATKRLNLRQITLDDLNEFFILKSDERLLKYYDAQPKTYEEARRKLQALNDDITNRESITWGITLKNVDQLIGSICFWNISAAESKAEIGYELMVDWQGKGIMHEAVEAVIAYGFDGMQLQQIEAFPNPNNGQSTKLLEKNAFIRGANFQEIDPVSGKLLERVIYILRKNNCR